MPATNWWVHRFISAGAASYVINHVAFMINEDLRRPNNDTGYTSITKAEAALSGIGIENGSSWYIHRTEPHTSATRTYIVDHSSTESYHKVCPASPPGYSTIQALANNKRLSSLHSTGTCS